MADFFEKCSYHRIDKADLPHKIWNECVRCPLFPSCNEIALIRSVSPEEAPDKAENVELTFEKGICTAVGYNDLGAVLKDLGKNFTLTAAQAKLESGRLAVRAAEEAVQIHGGYGYIEEYPVCRFYRDAKILTIGEGTDEVQQMVIARALGA